MTDQERLREVVWSAQHDVSCDDGEPHPWTDHLPWEDAETERAAIVEADAIIRGIDAARVAAPSDGLRVWVVTDTGEHARVVGVYASEPDAFEDVDARSGRGARPDIRHRLRVESWRVRTTEQREGLDAAPPIVECPHCHEELSIPLYARTSSHPAR